jgi:DNA (cytosine-5)-methyltransferase 1
MFNYLTIATGIGAPEEAVRNLPNWNCKAFSEIDRYPKSYFKKRNPNSGVDLDDFTKLTDKQISAIGAVNLIIASLPCQSFSVSGNRKGFSDARGNLFFDYLRIVKMLRPDYLVMENVKGLQNHDGGKTLATIETEIEKLGYQIEWNILNSKDFGVPQNRERIYLIGRHSRTKPKGAFFPLRSHYKEDSRRVGEEVSYCLDANYAKGTNTTLKGRRQLIQVNQPVHSNNRVYNPEGLAPTLNTMQGGNRQPFILTERRTEEAKKIRREHKAKTGKDFSPRRGKEVVPRTDGLVGTLTTSPTIEQTLVDEHARVRRLTPLECWRLQGFPDECYDLANEIGLSNTRQYKALGNAITVPVFRAIAERLDCLNDEKELNSYTKSILGQFYG